jgi:hypothetical protein
MLSSLGARTVSSKRPLFALADLAAREPIRCLFVPAIGRLFDA